MQRRTMYPSPSSLLSHKIRAHHYSTNLKPGNWHWCNWQTLFRASFTHICVCASSSIVLLHITRATMPTVKILNCSIISKTSLLLWSFLALSSSYTLKSHPQWPANLRQCVLDQTDSGLDFTSRVGSWNNASQCFLRSNLRVIHSYSFRLEAFRGRPCLFCSLLFPLWKLSVWHIIRSQQVLVEIMS